MKIHGFGSEKPQKLLKSMDFCGFVDFCWKTTSMDLTILADFADFDEVRVQGENIKTFLKICKIHKIHKIHIEICRFCKNLQIFTFLSQPSRGQHLKEFYVKQKTIFA